MQESSSDERDTLHFYNSAISDYVIASKYARYIPELKRRETWNEIVDRVVKFHVEHFPKLEKEIKDAFQFVREKRVLPSMRSAQFAGEAANKENARLYNCCATYVDRPRVFAEIMYLLLCGCGVGFSVQRQHVNQLPKITTSDYRNIKGVHIIQDSIQGWAEAVEALIWTYTLQDIGIEFDYSKIRAKGTLLKTSGGRAPGPDGLRKALEGVEEILAAAQGRQLKPIECHDIICKLADAVLSGGVRRSALLSQFDADDEEMVNAKIGNWFDTHPWRSNANNSATIVRKLGQDSKEFEQIFEKNREFGEPGFVFVDSPNHVYNPCAEIAMKPDNGFSFCNLTEVNVANLVNADDFFKRVVAATFIGTLQAAYTKFNFLTEDSANIAKRDALLGVSLTGIAETYVLTPEIQRAAADLAVKVNISTAKMLGINAAKRVTCVKPSGTATLALGNSGSGIHPVHAQKYIRRVTAKFFEPIFQHYFAFNSHQCVQKPNGDWVIEFPMEAPLGSRTKDDTTGLEFLMEVRNVQQNWVIPGTNPHRLECDDPRTHNVSATCVVGDTEWESIKFFVWENRHVFSGISFLPYAGDKIYAFPPMEAVRDEDDLTRWENLRQWYSPVDYTLLAETTDETTLQSEKACAGGQCDIV